MTVVHVRGSSGWLGATMAIGAIAWSTTAANGVAVRAVDQTAHARERAPRQDTEYLTFNASGKSARLVLRAGEHGANGGMSFNGAQRGGHEVVLPVGWRVQVTLVNDDSSLPHSAIIVPAGDSVPNRVTTPAFAGAVSEGAADGTLAGDSTAFSFTTERPGAYWLFCAVPGHGKAGMYLRLTVSRTARVPRYQ